MAASASGRRRLPAEITTAPARHVGAARAHVVARPTRAVERDALRRRRARAPRARRLSAPAGSGAPVAIVMAVRGSRRHRVVAGERPAGDGQRAGRVGCPHGVAVHRRVVERRQVVRGMHVGRDDAADERARERERLGRQRREPLEQERPRLVREQRSGIGGGHGPML